jgi:hypothetical protein
MKKSVSYKLVVILNLVAVVALLAACGATQPAAAAPAAPAAKVPTGVSPCPNPPPCKTGHECRNYPFAATDCWTSDYGPAKADVVVGNPVTSPNMLYCEGNTYALCFFSGPPTPTGVSSSNNALPCVLHGDIASCTCQAYTSGPNFVDINGILNRGAYFQTVNLCGTDGSKCRNLANCGPGGDKKGCQDHPPAPVCAYVKNQNPNNPKVSLMPKADLISTFSFAMSGKGGPYVLGSTACTGLYAGCMTAPCTYGPNHKSPTANGELVQCQCPTYNGPNYQIGQKGQSCSITGGSASYVWSAANTVN